MPGPFDYGLDKSSRPELVRVVRDPQANKRKKAAKKKNPSGAINSPQAKAPKKKVAKKPQPKKAEAKSEEVAVKPSTEDLHRELAEAIHQSNKATEAAL